jgi:chromosome segregation ATPase
MKKNIYLIIIIALVILTGFSLSRYIYLQKANLELVSVIKQNRTRIDELVTQLMSEKELNQQLAKEKDGLSKELLALSEQVKKADLEVAQAKEQLGAIATKINLLKKENTYLAQLKYSFDEKLTQAKKENESLEAKFNSLDELKKAIKDLKKKMHDDRVAAKNPAKVAEQIDGNRGYIIWKGQTTLKTKVKIEVTPAP